MYQKGKMCVGLVILASFLGISIAGATPPAVGNKTYAGTTICFPTEAVPTYESLAKLIPEFEKKSGIKVEMKYYPQQNLVEKEMLDLAGKTGVYDLMAIPFEQFGKFVEMGYLQPIEKFMKDPELREPNLDPDDFVQQLWRISSIHKGKTYGFPTNGCLMFIWYRKDLFNDLKEKAAFRKKYGYELTVPANWIQYRDIAEFFTRPDKNLYGVAIAAKRHKALVNEWMNYMYSFGGKILDEEGRPVINCPENVEALKFFKSLMKFTPPGATEYTWDEVTTAFQQGLVAMALQWNDQVLGVEDPSKSKIVGKVGYSAQPAKKRRVSWIGIYSYVIPKYSKHPEAAYLFMQWAASKEVDAMLGKQGIVPIRMSTYLLPEVKKIPWFYPATLESLRVAVGIPSVPEWPEMSQYLRIMLSKALLGEVTAQEALVQVQNEFEKILGR